jgi:hypothetical protein
MGREVCDQMKRDAGHPDDRADLVHGWLLGRRRDWRGAHMATNEAGAPMTDIREQAAKAAREWRLKLKHPADPLHASGEAAYQIGYEAGYEAAKAEADAERKLRDVVDEIVHPAHPYDKDCRCDLCRSYRIAHSWNGGSHD